MTVVVFAQDCDSPVDQVVLALNELGVPVFRADLSWFPQRLSVDARFHNGAWSGRLSTPARSVEFADIRSIWYRNPAAFRFPGTMSDVERTYAHREARLGLGGVLATLPVTWVNNPNRAADAMYKPLQLTTAAACGLSVPPTLVTNRPGSVLEFARESPDGVICKTFGPNSVTEEDVPKVVYTHRLDGEDLGDLRGVRTTTHQLQHWIDKAREARVIVIGEQIFGIGIDAHSASSRIDWRADFDALTYELVDVPPQVEKGTRRYMDILKLAYAAFDFVIERGTGQWLFLESNSSGGYNAALLSHRLGDTNVYSIDIEPELVDLAKMRLAALGYRPFLATQDGAQGLAEYSPYDRLVATCSVPAIPWPWIQQTTIGGLILADVKPGGSAGNLVLLRRYEDRAEGRFDLRYGSFMGMRRAGTAARPAPLERTRS